jgi:hypothetical protein
MANYSAIMLKTGFLILLYTFAGCDSRIDRKSAIGQNNLMDTLENIRSLESTPDPQSALAIDLNLSENSKSDRIEALSPSSSLPKPPQTLPSVLSDLRPGKKDPIVPDSTTLKTMDAVTPPNKSLQNEVNSVSVHYIWDNLLQTHVGMDGKVNYKGFIRDSAQLNMYLNLLSQNHPDDLTRNDKIAFWINAYNAYTVKLIVQNYPVKTIMDLDKGKVWDRKWINLNRKTLSLNDIEHNILFKFYPDARYHFALVCAAKSCPPLYNNAWEGQTLEDNLQKRTKIFIGDTNFNHISSNSLTLSKLFDWYRSDFKDIIAFINQFQMTKVSKDALITFNEYDWDLNER